MRSYPVSKRVVELRYDGLLEKGKQDFMHFLGTSKLEWALVLTDIQRAIRKHPYENFTVTFDCASPYVLQMVKCTQDIEQNKMKNGVI